MSDYALKPGWQTWRFDQMAISVTDRIDNPAEAGVEHYVGLEHLDTDSLKIRRWGVPTDVEATKLRFRKGDIIFGRRRVYQRKVGVAEFDGICSAHALVLRPKTDVILPEFLPFFMQSDFFMNRALEISVGSLSPTINWRTLASQEFALPPMEEQRRIAQLLWQTSHNLSAFIDLKVSASNLIHSFRKALSAIAVKDNLAKIGLLGYEGPWKVVALGNLLEMNRESVNVNLKQVYQEIGVRSFGRGVFFKELNTGASLDNKRVFWITPGKLIVNIVFAWEGAVAITGTETSGSIGSHRFPMYEAKTNQTDINYIRHYLLTPDGLTKLLQASPGGAGRNKTLGQQSFLNIKIPMPPIEIQKGIADQADTLIKAEEISSQRLNKTHLLMRSLIDSTLEPGMDSSEL